MTVVPEIRASEPSLPSATPVQRRGACPSLAAPMQTGDGLLVRLRPAGGGLGVKHVLALAAAAERFGNGRLDVTARGNLQVRGLRPETVEPFSDALAAAALEIESGTAVEVPPLAGLDSSERADPRALAAALRALTAQYRLAPKLTLVVDGGGVLTLADQSADLRLEAVAPDRWRIALAGTAATAVALAHCAEKAVVPAVRQVLEALVRFGPFARGRDLDAAALRVALASAEGGPSGPAGQAVPGTIPPIGLLDVPGCPVLGLLPAFGQMPAAALRALAEEGAGLGLETIRPAPGRTLLLLGLPADQRRSMAARAAPHGFSADPDDAARRISACAGRGACASGGLDTQRAARIFLDTAPGLLDGSLDLHLSGCAKGCAHPAPAGLVVVATPFGQGLVVGGTASAVPIAYQDEAALGEAALALSRLVEEEKQIGESVAACLKRLEPARLAHAFRQDGPADCRPRQD